VIHISILEGARNQKQFLQRQVFGMVMPPLDAERPVLDQDRDLVKASLTSAFSRIAPAPVRPPHGQHIDRGPLIECWLIGGA
jgi:hypothetical protein